MNVVIDTTHTVLGNDTLNDLMEMKVNGPSVMDFKIEGAVDKGKRKGNKA